GSKVTPQWIGKGVDAVGAGFGKAVNKLEQAGSKLGQKFNEQLSKMADGLNTGKLAIANGASVPAVPHVNKMDSGPLPQTDVQKNYNKVMKEMEESAAKKVEGTGESKRLIPGTPGKVTGGSSTKLGKNMFEEMGLRRSTKRTPYQAQHVIPAEFNEHPVIEKIGMDMDHASNGFFLRIPDKYTSSTSRHQGYHSVYSDFVESKLNKININQDIAAIEKQVFDLQQKLRKLQEKGLPLYMTDDYLQKELKKIKSKGMDDYLLDRARNKDKIKPVWDRGGGATIDLWERWFDKL
ncbi:AHH domain-containing protein, partial [Paenibacillus terrae]